MFKFRLFGLLAFITLTLAQDGMVGRRVPSFIGTRGKKNQNDIEKVASPYFDVEPDIRLEDISEEASLQPFKRTNFGFQGTRGKKLDELTDKRTTTLGFTGTRGKKSDFIPYYKPTENDLNEILHNIPVKRKFFGMRGKKFPWFYNLMGARGKKGPSPNSFIGMRGRRSTEPVINENYHTSLKYLPAYLNFLTNGKYDCLKTLMDQESDYEISDDSPLIPEQLNSNDMPNV